MGVRISGVKEAVLELKAVAREVLEEVANGLAEIGESVVDGIVSGDLSDWEDQTGNLRSSVGYMVAIDGQIWAEGGFRVFAAADDGPERGKTFAREAIQMYPQGVALVIVAGMEYASYVESMDNKTVLAQGEIETRLLIDEMVRKLNQQYSK